MPSEERHHSSRSRHSHYHSDSHRSRSRDSHRSKDYSNIDQVTEVDRAIGIVIETVIESEVTKMRIAPCREWRLNMERGDVLR